MTTLIFITFARALTYVGATLYAGGAQRIGSFILGLGQWFAEWAILLGASGMAIVVTR